MLKISDALLSTLIQAFERERRNLCYDAAKILRVPEKQVDQIVKQAMSTVTFTVFEEDEKRQTCPILIQTAVVLERCRGPCLMGTGRCLKHQTVPDPPESSAIPAQLTRIERTDAIQPPLWCNEETEDVYNAEGKVVGHYDKDENILSLFSFEEE
jgi:hypothetical protein